MDSIQPIEPSQPLNQPGQGPELPESQGEQTQPKGNIKDSLIAQYGEEKGTEAYNSFMKMMAIQMVMQVQKTDERARKAAAEMRRAGQQ
ncbi:MAG: hypothetical protein WAM28_04945 [Chlamydiales bacterium]